MEVGPSARTTASATAGTAFRTHGLHQTHAHDSHHFLSVVPGHAQGPAQRPGGAQAKCPRCSNPVVLSPPCAGADPAPSKPPSTGTDTKSPLHGSGSRHDPTGAGSNNSNPPGPVGHAGTAYDFLAPPQGPDEIGRLGPYRVLGVLGLGGMGIVFKAEDPSLRRAVALKVMLPSVAGNPTAKTRFLREARAQAAIEHDHVIAVYQVGEDRGIPFLAMPLLKGQTLSAALRQGAVLPAADVVRIGREMAEGLAAAHDRGLIHRDVKPGNVWLEGGRRRVKILDFGLARSAADAEVGLGTVDNEPVTRAGAAVGTPAYMSPEQARGQAVDHRTDLFSLGVVMYQMAAGDIPFRGADVMAVLTALALDAPVPPILRNPELPPAVNDLILRLLAKKAADRPPSGEAVAAELRQIEEALTRPSGTVPSPYDPPPPAQDDPWADLGASDPTAVVGRPAPPAGMNTSRLAAASSRKIAPLAAPAGDGRGTAAGPPGAEARPRRRAGMMAAAAGLAALLLGGLVWMAVKAAKPEGTLVVESDVPEAELTLRQEGAVVRERVRAGEHVLPAGEYLVELADRSQKFFVTPTRLVLGAKGREAVTVRRLKPAAPKKGAVTAPTVTAPAAVPPPVPGPAPAPMQAMPAAEGGIVLFDGKDAAAWQAVDGQGFPWTLRDGYMETVVAAGDIRTRQTFGDCRLHLEYWLEAGERGADLNTRTNSGIYFQGLYEVQIADDSDLPAGNRTTGGLFGMIAPRMNASKPAGEWQTLDITFKAPGLTDGVAAAGELTVVHNGQTVADRAALRGAHRRSQDESLERGPGAARPAKP